MANVPPSVPSGESGSADPVKPLRRPADAFGVGFVGARLVPRAVGTTIATTPATGGGA